MPSSARKSSISSGIRRGPQKAHIPYRGDNPEVGKKTGIEVRHVERKSDGFEPFEEVLQHADGRTPPRPKGRKKSLAQTPRRDDDYDDEDGEEPMELSSPINARMANMRPPTTPTNNRSRLSSRPVARTSDVDFDQIPSPGRSKSAMQRVSRNAAPGPSSLSRSTRGHSPPQQYDSPEHGDYDNDVTMDNGDLDDYGPQEEDNPSPRRRSSPVNTSFTQINEEEEEEEDESLTPRPVDKGKRKEVIPEELEEEEDIEDEIANSLEDVGLGPDSDEDEPEGSRPSKKTRSGSPKRKPGRPTKSGSKKENREYREGTRRSQRERIKPLEYWRGERYVYGRRPNCGPVLVAPIKEVLRIPKEVPAPLGKRKRGGSTRARSVSKKEEGTEEPQFPPLLPVANPEEGWDDKTEAKCTVIHYTSREEVERRIAWTASMVAPRLAADHGWFFDKIFGDDEFIAAGQLVIPVGGRKPPKAAKDNTYVFYVIEGAVNFKIHETSMILATGGMFMVPRGNTYFIENISEREARLFFTQARKVGMSKSEAEAKEQAVEEMNRRKSIVRSSSVGAAPTKTPPKLNGRAASMAAFPTSRKS